MRDKNSGKIQMDLITRLLTQQKRKKGLDQFVHYIWCLASLNKIEGYFVCELQKAAFI